MLDLLMCSTAAANKGQKEFQAEGLTAMNVCKSPLFPIMNLQAHRGNGIYYLQHLKGLSWPCNEAQCSAHLL